MRPDHPHTNTPVTGADRTVHHVHNPAPAGVDPHLADQIRKDAYKAGVADERARHKRNPLLSILIALAAVLGLAVLGAVAAPAAAPTAAPMAAPAAVLPSPTLLPITPPATAPMAAPVPIRWLV